jgi:gliding motility-associated-like protein
MKNVHLIISLLFLVFSHLTFSQCDPPIIDGVIQPTCSVATGSVSLSGLPAGSWTITTNPDGIITNGSGSTATLVTIAAGNTYNFTVSDGTCTSPPSSDITLIAAPQTPTPPLIGNITQPTCSTPFGSVELTDLPIGSYTITETSSGTTVTGTSTSNSFNNLAPSGSYSFTVTNQDGCTSSNSTAGSISALPNNPSNPTASVAQQPTCDLSTGTIEITAPLSPIYLYSIDGATYQSSPQFSSVNVGSYNITVKNSNTGCISSGIVTVSVDAPSNFPSIAIENKENVRCAGGDDGSIKFIASGGTSPYSYTWIPNVSVADSAINLSLGTYSITVTDDGGCTASISVTLTQPDSLKVLGSVTSPNCETSAFGAISTSVTGGTQPFQYAWLPGGETSSGLTSIPAGNYSLTLTDANDCELIKAFEVETIGTFTIYADPFVSTISDGMTVQIQATGALTYQWTNGESLSCNDCENPIASPSVTTVYVVEGFNEIGCSGNALVKVNVNPVCGELYVPNTFTPNGDLMNDELTIGGLKSDCINEYEFEVYDRWGTKVFQTDDIKTSWNGTYQDLELNSGVYFYRLKIVMWDAEVIEKSGNCSIVR